MKGKNYSTLMKTFVFHMKFRSQNTILGISSLFSKYKTLPHNTEIIQITTMLMLHPNMKILYLTYVGHLINHSQLLILNMYHLKK